MSEHNVSELKLLKLKLEGHEKNIKWHENLISSSRKDIVKLQELAKNLKNIIDILEAAGMK